MDGKNWQVSIGEFRNSLFDNITTTCLLSPHKIKPLRRYGSRAYRIQLYGVATVFTTIVEVYPNFENQVIEDDAAPSGMRFEYTIHDDFNRTCRINAK